MDNSPTYARNHVHLQLTSSALFENYDDDLKQLVAGLKGKLDGDVQTLRGGE